MHTSLLLLSVAWSMTAAEPPPDFEKLAGEWVFVERSVHGEPTKAEDLAKLRLIIAKDHSFLIYQEDNAVVQGKLLKANQPGVNFAADRQIASRSEFSGKFEPVYRQKGLVQFDKDRLTIVFSREPGDPRPVEFNPKDAKGLVREVLKRK